MAEEVAKKSPRGRRKKVKEEKKYAIPDDVETKQRMIEQFIVEHLEDEEKYEICPFIKD